MFKVKKKRKKFEYENKNLKSIVKKGNTQVKPGKIACNR